MTARSEILAVFPELRARLGRDAFTPAEIIRAVHANGTAYAESTLRTHIVSIMCMGAPDHHGARVRELERVDRGLYRLRSDLGEGEVAAPHAHWSARTSPPPDTPAADRHSWPWEGAVQAAFVHFLSAHRWQVTRVADTATKERGIDVLAHKDGRSLAAEVKGYPLTTYADPAREGEPKRTPPTVQARIWYASALFSALTIVDSHPNREPLVVLPDFPRYRSLAAQTKTGLARAGVFVVYVDPSGQATSDAWTP